MSRVSSFFKAVGVLVLLILFFAFLYVLSGSSLVRSSYENIISSVSSFSPSLADFLRVFFHYLHMMFYYSYLIVKSVIEFFSSLIYNARPVSVR